MGINSVMSQGLQGMQQSHQRIREAASDVARAGTVDRNQPGIEQTETNTGNLDVNLSDSKAIDVMDIAKPMVVMKQEELIFEASAKVVKTADQMLGSLIDIKT